MNTSARADRRRRPSAARPSTRSEIGDPHPIAAVGDCDLGVAVAKIAVEDPALSCHRTRSPGRHCGVIRVASRVQRWLALGVRRPEGGFCRSWFTDAVMAGEPPVAPNPVPIDAMRLGVPKSYVLD